MSRPIEGPAVHPWVAWLLVPEGNPAPTTASAAVAQEIVDWARRESLAGMVRWAAGQELRRQPRSIGTEHEAVLQAVHEALAPDEQALAAKAMLYEEEARRVVEALAEVGIRSLLLKGVAVAQWAYPASHLREYKDIDLVVPNHDEALRAADHLITCGYQLIKKSHPIVAHDMLLVRQLGQGIALEIDLHWNATGKAFTQHAFTFEDLWVGSIPLPGLGAHAKGLSPNYALIHASINRTSDISNGLPDRPRLLFDIFQIIHTASNSIIEKTREQAIIKQVAGFVGIAIRHSQEMWRFDDKADLMKSLMVQSSHEPFNYSKLQSWPYAQLKQLNNQPNLRNAIAWIFLRIFPSRETLLYQFQPKTALARSYPALLLKHALAAIKQIKK